MKTDGQKRFTEINFEIKPYDIDAAGHVNNAVYLNWLEDLRVKLFRELIPLDTLIKKNIHLVVAFTNIKYKVPLLFFNKPKGVMKVEKYCRGIWYLSAEFKTRNSVTTKAFQKCVLFDKRNNRMNRGIIFNDEEELFEVNKY
jgi:acyl-CoA thioester hydrolase